MLLIIIILINPIRNQGYHNISQNNHLLENGFGHVAWEFFYVSLEEHVLK